jgi:hypothetical protein
MIDEDHLLAWFDHEGYDVHLSQVDGVWTASALLRSQRISAAATETGMTRAEALVHLQTKLESTRGQPGGSPHAERDPST